jgi:hypothetical protein
MQASGSLQTELQAAMCWNWTMRASTAQANKADLSISAHMYI